MTGVFNRDIPDSSSGHETGVFNNGTERQLQVGIPQDDDDEKPTDDFRAWARNGIRWGGGNPLIGQQENRDFMSPSNVFEGNGKVSSAREGSESMSEPVKAQVECLAPNQCKISPESRIARK